MSAATSAPSERTPRSLRLSILGTLAAIALTSATVASRAAPQLPSELVPELAGTWAGTMSHDGESQPIALTMTPADSAGRVAITLSIPVVHLDRLPMGRFALKAEGDSIRLGPFRFLYDARERTLTGNVPRALVPAYDIPMRLKKVDPFDPPARPALRAPEASPVWEFVAGSPLWAGATFANGTVYAGAQDGRVFALDARSGTKQWEFLTGGPVRCRPTIASGALYVQADDGHLYKLASATGQLQWRLKIVEKPIERLPFDNPKSRYDRFGSDVTIAGHRLYAGTHDGKLLALDAKDGRRLWEFAAGDAILAAPALADGKLYFGSFDRFVYAIEAETGRLLWKRETQGPIVSTPAVQPGRIVVGNRAYDLLGLDAQDGGLAWKRHIWMSWVESSATLRDGVAYVGSSDAAAVFAFDAGSGKRLWSTDVHGWSWGQPAVSERRVYAGISSQVGYLVGHSGGVVSLDRATGAMVWRYSAAAPDSGAYGFPGSPTLGAGLVFVTGLDGRIRAFAE